MEMGQMGGVEEIICLFDCYVYRARPGCDG